MRAVVVALTLLVGSACPPAPVDPAPVCRLYVDCFLDTGDDANPRGYRTLAVSDDDRLRCFDGFLDDDGGSTDLDDLLAPVRRAYGERGACWGQGYTGTAGVESNFAGCEAHCEIEVLGECQRRRSGDASLQACPGNEGVDAFCNEADIQEVDDARCAGAPVIAAVPAGEGEGE